MKTEDPAKEGKRLSAALSRFAIAITVLNLFGHFFLGFEASWLTPLVALATSYSLEIGLETLDAWANRRKPRYLGGGPRGLVMFLRSAHITALACGMLLYANSHLWAIVLAIAVAIGSKYVFRVRISPKSTRHVFNPSNMGITATLILLPWVGIAPPYQFTESLPGLWGWLPVGIILVTGSLLNFKMTRRGPLILAWVIGFWVQAVLRNSIHGTSIESGMLVTTGVAFVLFTFYMVTDPMTTPKSPRNQVVFGFSVAAGYALFMELHIVFGLFYALTLVCAARGILIAVRSRATRLAPQAAVHTGLTPSETPSGETPGEPVAGEPSRAALSGSYSP